MDHSALVTDLQHTVPPLDRVVQLHCNMINAYSDCESAWQCWLPPSWQMVLPRYNEGFCWQQQSCCSWHRHERRCNLKLRTFVSCHLGKLWVLPGNMDCAVQLNKDDCYMDEDSLACNWPHTFLLWKGRPWMLRDMAAKPLTLLLRHACILLWSLIGRRSQIALSLYRNFYFVSFLHASVFPCMILQSHHIPSTKVGVLVVFPWGVSLHPGAQL